MAQDHPPGGAYLSRNVDGSMAMRDLALGRGVSSANVPRPKPSAVGQPVKIALNTFHVLQLPKKDIFQYDVLIGSGTEKRGLIQKVWASKEIKKQLGGGFVFDGNKLAWSMKQLPEIRCIVDLDMEEGRTPKAGKENKHRIVLRSTKKVPLDMLQAYLDGKTSMCSAVIESITCLDHLLREIPSKNLTAIKRSFFSQGGHRVALDRGVVAFKGVYSSVRIAHFTGTPGPAKLSINTDVANGTFWMAGSLVTLAVALLGARDEADMVANVARMPGAKMTLRKLHKLHVTAGHRGRRDDYVISHFIYESAHNHKFEKDGKKISIFQYFVEAFSVRLKWPDLPLVATTRKGVVLPMEALSVKENERYNFKLDDRQTANMIKFAVTLPAQRLSSIQEGLKMLNWPQDPVLNAFGMKVDTNKAVVEGRLLPPPKVVFANGDARPGTSGRWDLRGKKFISPNSAPLKSWAVCVINSRRGGKPEKTVIENFIKLFIQTYIGHGGRVENRQPALSLAVGDSPGDWVTTTWNVAGNQSQMRPQILIFVLPDKDSVTYGRIKRSCECRYGVVSQCMQYAHVQKAQAQYMSNVCMKFNAKLGGATARAVGPRSDTPGGQFTVPTLCIGADVSHAAPGSQTQSMAALTVGLDKLGIRYAAACALNGYRTEIISPAMFEHDFPPLLQTWMQNVGSGKLPKRLIYFRDGCSEGEYHQVLASEVRDIKEALKNKDPNNSTKLVVVVGSKRHHVRFFPEKGDKNGNPLPGTLVETGVTHPFENDFYLCSHSAIKGTARPMHYYVLLNEAGMSNEELQTLIYEQCYQFIRSTTPVSQHPAIYYAHVVSNRAMPHAEKWANRTSAPSQAAHSQSGDTNRTMDTDKLMPMPNGGQICTSMWYI